MANKRYFRDDSLELFEYFFALLVTLDSISSLHSWSATFWAGRVWLIFPFSQFEICAVVVIIGLV